MSKPVVTYTNAEFIEVGASARVYPNNHPSPRVSNKSAVQTSYVLQVVREGRKVIAFETENTIYELKE